MIAATLERADPRDVLLVRRDVVDAGVRASLSVLSSSPRRSWLLAAALPALLPWPVDDGSSSCRCAGTSRRGCASSSIGVGRGPRARRRQGGARSAARFGPPFEARRARSGALLDECRGWCCRCAKCRARRRRARSRSRRRRANARRGRSAQRDLASSRRGTPSGGARDSGRVRRRLPRGAGRVRPAARLRPVVSVRGRSTRRARRQTRVGPGASAGAPPPRAAEAASGRARTNGTARRGDRWTSPSPADGAGFWVARAEALPDGWPPRARSVVWAAGGTTWRRLAARGVWVHGCADGLGDAEPPAVDALAGRVVAPPDARRPPARSRGARHLRRRRAAAGRPAVAHALLLDERHPVPRGARAVARASRDGWHGSGPGPYVARRSSRRWAPSTRAPRLAGLRPMAERRHGGNVLDVARRDGRPAAMSAVRTRAPWSQLRLRQSAHLRDMLAETTFSVAQLIQPLFVVDGLTGAEPIAGLGDNARLGEAAALEQIARDLDAGVRHFLLFAVPSRKQRARPDVRSRAARGRRHQARGSATRCTCGSTSASARRPTHGHCAMLDDGGRHRPRADARRARADGGRARRRRRRRRQPERHDGRPHGASCARRSTRRATSACRS